MGNGILQLLIGTMCTLLTAQSFAFDGVCKFIFEEAASQQSVFAKLETLEENYQSLLVEVTSSYGKIETKNAQKSLNLIVEQIQMNQKTLDKAINEALNDKILEAAKDMYKVETNHVLLRDRLSNLLPNQQPVRQKKYDWNEIVERPELLTPNKTYNLESPGGIPISIKFSSRILQEFFYSDRPQDLIASKKILRAMTRYSGSSHAGSSGLVELNGSKNIYEVRIIGHHAVGAIRVTGIKHEGVIHFVHMEKHGNHNATFSNHLIKNTTSKFKHDF